MTAAGTPIGITGATGRLGGRVARRLAAAGVEQRLLVRDISRAPTMPAATAVRAPFDDSPTCCSNVSGITIPS